VGTGETVVKWRRLWWYAGGVVRLTGILAPYSRD
jgi:hypothetical protein